MWVVYSLYFLIGGEYGKYQSEFIYGEEQTLFCVYMYREMYIRCGSTWLNVELPFPCTKDNMNVRLLILQTCAYLYPYARYMWHTHTKYMLRQVCVWVQRSMYKKRKLQFHLRVLDDFILLFDCHDFSWHGILLRYLLFFLI